jgi:hypothetical protein
VGYFAPLGFYSKSLQRHHKKWTSLDVELYAIVASFRHFEHMILGCKTTVMLDCKAIEFLHKHKDGNGRASRWFNYLSQFEYSVTHVKGIANGLSDYLSRNPIDDPLNTGDGELLRDTSCSRIREGSFNSLSRTCRWVGWTVPTTKQR